MLTLTRDRLAYTQHCFEMLRRYAGCAYDHYVLDQASEDGTAEWLLHADLGGEANSITSVIFGRENIGISRGMNKLLDDVKDAGYDAIVKFDNDCELVEPDTLRVVCELAIEGGCLLSPRVRGLKQPPSPSGAFRIGDETIYDIPQIGGIFLAAPGSWYERFRYSESNPRWGGDDVEVCRAFRDAGGKCGYVQRLTAWHYETTVGQEQRFADYFTRKYAEMG